MTRDVLISVKGLHSDNNAEEEAIEVFSAGKYYFRNGKHYVEYEEQDAESQAVTKNRLILQNSRLEVCRRGMLNSKMVFEENHRNTSWYETPFGSLLAGIEVTAMQVTETEDLIEISVDYVLEVNEEHIADSRIRIRIMAKDSGLFRLT